MDVLSPTDRPDISSNLVQLRDAAPSPQTLTWHGNTIHNWLQTLKSAFTALFDPTGSKPLGLGVEYCTLFPRRGHANIQSQQCASEIAALLYPAPTDSSLPQLIKYVSHVAVNGTDKLAERDIVTLRRAIIEAHHAAQLNDDTHGDTWKSRISAQGPWNETEDPLPLTGVSSLPMPVEISDEESLRPFFQHLSEGEKSWDDAPSKGKEEYYHVDVGIWDKGMLYVDGRMDLCKQVLGPLNITALMQSLSTNTSVHHFLLGNNVIGPVGAQAIADFVHRYPNKIETWYLAGNCIDSEGFSQLSAAFAKSDSITNIWLKRNPLGPAAALNLYELITSAPNLRTLDLDQTELGDVGVARLFNNLIFAQLKSEPVALRNIYLNGNGISTNASEKITAFLSTPNCALESLYMSLNPIGDADAIVLAQGLKRNKSLQRLSITSGGINSDGAAAVLDALRDHPSLMTLCLGQHFATEDLGMRYNYLTDSVEESLITFIRQSRVKMLQLDTTAMSVSVLNRIASAAALSETLQKFHVKSIHGNTDREVKAQLKSTLERNVRTEHGDGMTYQEFEAGEKRWLVSPRDVRLIDSGYRNHDAGLARRGKMVLKKDWEDDGETIRRVMNAGKAVVGARV
ncbi:uncharacterized protein KY384_003528 [Bacidia gigantensis]|uniref:uncharacterized protein n=1 Tax=Bacidia gigantensis TaxID=2732470 RepID=UPI001D04FAD7|nr:uncharacterized protein KY384_003528 [Bacidia gigantensis]KAG8531892.1 hypothetical protein KY384_003528 [Bacidia gigantensis]